MTRQLALEGGRNFRDLGGYPTRDGRHVRWGRIYRSGVLTYLTPADQSQLDALGIRVVCDFRNALEREREAVRWTRPDLEVLSWNYDHRLVSLRAMLGAEPLTPTTGRLAMIRLYRALPTYLAEPYAGLFRRLAAGDLPLVFACAAGKDRTGVAAALVLETLGVPREVVLEDFRLTEQAVDLERLILQRPERGIGLDPERRALVAVPAEARAPLIAADPDYLDAAFDAIASTHGSLERYVQERLGVTSSVLEQLRAHLLEG